MPSADPKSQISIRFNSPEEKTQYMTKVKEKYGLGFAKWAAELVREHFRDDTVDSPRMLELKERLDENESERQRLEAENLYLRRLNESNSREIKDIRGRIYGQPKTYSSDLFSMMYSWFSEHESTTRKELLDHLVDYIKVPNLVEEMKAIEKILLSQGVITIENGEIRSQVTDS